MGSCCAGPAGSACLFTLVVAIRCASSVSAGNWSLEFLVQGFPAVPPLSGILRRGTGTWAPFAPQFCPFAVFLDQRPARRGGASARFSFTDGSPPPDPGVARRSAASARVGTRGFRAAGVPSVPRRCTSLPPCFVAARSLLHEAEELAAPWALGPFGPVATCYVLLFSPCM